MGTREAPGLGKEKTRELKIHLYGKKLNLVGESTSHRTQGTPRGHRVSVLTENNYRVIPSSMARKKGQSGKKKKNGKKEQKRRAGQGRQRS